MIFSFIDSYHQLWRNIYKDFLIWVSIRMEVRKMRMKPTLSVTVGIAILLTTLFVTSGTSVATTPLFTVRMEQASTDMNFLIPLVDFLYMTGKGNDLKYDSPRCHSISSSDTLGTTIRTCEPPCIRPTPAPTGPVTCDFTCSYTCPDATCYPTCGWDCE